MGKVAQRRIAVSDIQDRHPEHVVSPTDVEYARLANELYGILKEDLSFMGDAAVRNTCVTLALYFEDLHSGTRQFETFTHLYRKMFGRYLPFYNSKDAADADAQKEAMTFMMWYSASAERENSILNPQNEGIINNAAKVWQYWTDVRDSIHPNSQLADYIYSEETQSDAYDVKNVLIWLQHRSLFGRWHNNPTVDDEPYGITQILPHDTSKHLQAYIVNSMSAFDCRTWPLSLRAQDIYAEMIRLEMDDCEDMFAHRIAEMESTHFGIYEVTGSNNKYVSLRDFKNNVIDVRLDSFKRDVSQDVRKLRHVVGAFLRFGNEWYTNGTATFLKFDAFDDYCNGMLEKDRAFDGNYGQYDEFIKQNNGERMYFFNDSREYADFMKNDLGIRNTELFTDEFSDNSPLMAFFEYNGQMTMITEGVPAICHPANRLYDKYEAEDYDINLIMNREACSPDALMYMIEQNLLPDALLNDIRGREYGKRIMQENMEFFARCMRRDIRTDSVCRKRSDKDSEYGDGLAESQYGKKYPYAQFVQLISDTDEIRSSANKLWHVVRTDNVSTVVRDERTGIEYCISTRDLYEAHLALSDNDIQIQTVAPFVGKKYASAASALLYNIVGRGSYMNYFRKILNTYLADKMD